MFLVVVISCISLKCIQLNMLQNWLEGGLLQLFNPLSPTFSWVHLFLFLCFLLSLRLLVKYIAGRDGLESMSMNYSSLC